MEKIKITCENLARAVEVPSGKTLAETADYLKIKLDHQLIGAVVNNKYVGLNYRLYNPKQVSFIDISNPEGMRIYTRSLIFMLFVAVREVLGGELYVLRSVSKGLYCEIRRNGDNKITEEEIVKLKRYLEKLHAEKLEIKREEIETSEALRKIDVTNGTTELLEQHGEIYTTIYTLENHSMTLFGDLAPNTSYINVFDVVPYYNGLLLRLPQQNDSTKLCEITKQDKMFQILTEFNHWQEVLGVRRLADLNKAIMTNHGAEIMQVAEALHEKKISVIADQIAEHHDKIKIVLIAGPSSSGKTTFSKRLAVQLIVNSIRPVTISIDDYFVNREDTPRDENGDYDFEALEAIDVKLFNENLLALLNGKEIDVPRFDFTQGKRVYDGTKMKLEASDVLIIEGTHGLTPGLTHLVPAENKFKIYISPMASINFDAHTRINTTDNRLIRRIVRDYKYRGYSAEDTIARWPSVRRGEDKYIYPNQEGADVMFNSALLYELSVLKIQAEPLLMEVPRNSPCFSEARRLTKFLSYIKPLPMEKVPPTSILREFLGGSLFKY